MCQECGHEQSAQTDTSLQSDRHVLYGLHVHDEETRWRTIDAPNNLDVVIMKFIVKFIITNGVDFDSIGFLKKYGVCPITKGSKRSKIFVPGIKFLYPLRNNLFLLSLIILLFIYLVIVLNKMNLVDLFFLSQISFQDYLSIL